MSGLTIADYSEWQGVVAPSGQQVVIIRAYNGYRPDSNFAQNRANAHAAGCAAVGLYAFGAPDRDPSQQAADLISTVGGLAANEWLIYDDETGAGDQQPRWQAWNTAVHTRYGRLNWLYSGDAFAKAHNLHPDWVASYGLGPDIPWKLWQNSDSYPWPWARSDSSVFPGNLAQFLAEAGIGAVIPVPPPAPPLTPSSSQTLVGGQTLLPGDMIVNVSGCRCAMQTDGNLAIYGSDNKVMWNSHDQAGVPMIAGTVAAMQTDGNFVLYAPGGRPLWATSTNGHPGSVIAFQNDSNLVVYAPGDHALWQSGT